MNKRDISSLEGVLGEWFLPNQVKGRIQGVLKQNDNGRIRLHSLDQIDDNGGLFFGGKNYEIIYGMLSTGPKVTLINSYMNAISHAPGYEESFFEPTALVVGGHVPEWNFDVEAIAADFDRIDDWFGVSPFRIGQPENRSEMTVSCKLPYFQPFEVGDKKIALLCNMRIKNMSSKDMSLQYSARAEIQFFEPKKITDALEELKTLSDFFTLCMGTKCNYRNISFTYQSNKNNMLLFNNGQQDIPLKKNLPPFLISYQHISKQFALCLNTWYIKKDNIAPIIDYFVEAHDDSSHQSVVMTFLKLAQALESFSRKTWGEPNEPKEQYDEKIQRILEKLSDNAEDQKWIEDMLKRPGANEPSNNKRFKNILQSVQELLQIQKDNVKKLAYKIVATRNYYTHFNENIKKEIYDNEEIYYVNVIMKETLRILLLRELWVSEDVILQGTQSTGSINDACYELHLN